MNNIKLTFDFAKDENYKASSRPPLIFLPRRLTAFTHIHRSQERFAEEAGDDPHLVPQDARLYSTVHGGWICSTPYRSLPMRSIRRKGRNIIPVFWNI